MKTRMFWLGGIFLGSIAAGGCGMSTTRSTELDDFAAQVAVAECARDARCGYAWQDERSVGAALVDCPSQLGDGIDDYFVAPIRDAIANGTVVYHPEEVGRCLDGFATECGGDSDRPCRAVFEGLIADDQPCDLDEQCGSDSRCVVDPAGTCPAGVCRHRPQAGESCTTASPRVGCDTHLWCSVPDGATTGTCRAYVPVGGACRTSDPLPCGFAAGCVASTLGAADGTCSDAFGQVGEPCAPVGCARGVVCDFATARCRAPRTDGTCLVGPGGITTDCATGTMCDATSATMPEGHCVPEPTLGEACTYLCAGGSRCATTSEGANVCAEPRRIGDACTFGGECLSGHCASGVCSAAEICAS